MNICTALRILVLSLPFAGVVHAETYTFDGHQLRQMQTSYDQALAGSNATSAVEGGMYLGYIAGVLDSLKAAGVVCSENDVSLDQAMQVVSNYINAHPEKWSGSAYELSTTPIIDSFPCLR